MRRHRKLLIGLLLAALVVAVVVLVWFQPQKLFIDERVNESLEGVDDRALEKAAEKAGEGETTEDPGSDLKVLGGGELRPLGHSVSGKVLLVELADGRRILRLQDLEAENGPDLRVYLSADEDDLAGDFVDLGALKGNLGNQNYAVPGDVDLERFDNAAIWCRRFAVGFAVASLT